MLDALFARFRGGGESTAMPMMDGPLKPNRRLEDAVPIGEPLADCDDLVSLDDGSLLVSGGRTIHRLAAPDFVQRSAWCECTGSVGALVAAGGKTIYAGIAGQGVVRIEDGRVIATLGTADGKPLRCVTALALLPDGRIAIAEGSTVNDNDGWTRDLLEQRATGRVLVASPDLSKASVLAAELAWPAGLRIQGDALWFSEAWRHRVQAMPLAGGAARTVVRNLPGYPGRMSPDASGDTWLAVFAVRTLLIEFVLREREYREAMLATVDPRYWIAPAYGTTGHHLEPLQGGAIKKLGIVKPWAPARSYGLVVRLSAQGEALDSLHSRSGGRHHGITAVRRDGDRLIVLSRGNGRVLACNAERGS